MNLGDILAGFLKGALSKGQKRSKQEMREVKRRNERIRVLEGGEDEYEARQSLEKLPGVGSKTAGQLYDAGFKTRTQARAASIEELHEIEGIGAKLASDISREGEVKDLDLSDEIPFSHYLDAVEPVKQLKREKRHEEAEKILLWCINQAENERRPPPWYFNQLAIIYRKDNRYDDEVALIKRYSNVLKDRNIEPEEVSSAAVKFVGRLDQARELAEKDR